MRQRFPQIKKKKRADLIENWAKRKNRQYTEGEKNRSTKYAKRYWNILVI